MLQQIGMYAVTGIAMMAAVAWSAALHAADDELAFGDGSWSLQCDNTRTCRAVGYHAEEGNSEPVLMQVSREAGPGTPIDIMLMPYSDLDFAGPVRLQVGPVVIDGLRGSMPAIPADDVRRLLAQLLAQETASVFADGKVWTLSLAGAREVMLKMDALQGRLDTPGAIVARGSRAESSVPRPRPAPRIQAVKPLPARAADDAIAARIVATLPPARRRALAEQCNDQDIDLAGIEAFRLDGQTLLLSLNCAIGAYNQTSFLWVARDRAPHRLRALTIDGQFDAERGSITSSMKMRGLGDCWAFEEWQYDGRTFVRSGASADPVCMGIPGGWQLPSYVTEVVPAKP